MIQPRKRIPLNGLWQLQPGTKNEPPTKWLHSVPVPSVVDCAEPDYDWREHEYHWYRTTFRVEEKYDCAWLTIEQAMFGTEVRLNGNSLGGDIACYTSQEYPCADALRFDVENELLIRVGLKQTLPPESAVGNDHERETFIPGIWGDVYVTQTGNPRIKLVQIIPHIEKEIAEARVWIENISNMDCPVKVSVRIRERTGKLEVSVLESMEVELESNAEKRVTFQLHINNVSLWSPEYPFLYELETCIFNHETINDKLQTTFGMREFKIAGRNFYLNGKKIFLRGGNIAFHRFLSDADRKLLPWKPDWVKKLLIDIPKAHNFNFFRLHIGHAYNRWYDIADEQGMLLQDEWQFWTTTGTKEQIKKEFTRWLRDNWNHPSIIIWDALNECSDDTVQKEIVPEMKRFDPARLWESVDFTEEHPYIYSLGPVMNDRKFGFTRSLNEIENDTKPTMLNEFCWWWFDNNFKPTVLMDGVVERWLGKDWTQEELVTHQSFLLSELVELFRRMRVDAIQPFVYLSNNAGPTANWFAGNIKDLQPKPILATLKNVFAPFGVSIELWDRHFFTGEERTIRLFIFNDEHTLQTGKIRYGIMDNKSQWVVENSESVVVNGNRTEIREIRLRFPSFAGMFCIRAELFTDSDVQPVSF
ncbi:MAG: hypothetical protein HYZ34_03745, partial [Ignavibacteriae bacterium]|nr:hypothetical protein [Ignavibacteriota bacterium]